MDQAVQADRSRSRRAGTAPEAAGLALLQKPPGWHCS